MRILKGFFFLVFLSLCLSAETLTFDSSAAGVTLGGSMTWNGTGGGHLYCEQYGNDDWISFASPTYVQSFQMNYMPWQNYGGGSGSNITIAAFNSSGTQVWSSTENLSAYTAWSSWKTVTVNTANITQLMFYATGGFWPSVDNLVINSAPTPQPTLSVNNVNFGNVRIGTSASANLTVTNTGTSGSTLTGTINAASGEFTPTSGTQNFSLGASQTSSRTFTYTPTNRGLDNYQVSVTSNAGNANSLLTGYGVAPLLSTSVAANSTIDFGVVEYNQTQNLTLQNATPDSDLGNLTDLTILSATISGADAACFSLTNFTPGMVLDKNALFNLGLQFTNIGHTIATRNATLTIVTDQNAALGQAGATFTWNLTAQAIPEPSSFVVCTLALGLGFLWNKRRGI